MAAWLGMVAGTLALVAAGTKASAQWQSLNGGVNRGVQSFALSPDHSRLLVGGSFPVVYQDSLRANNIAWWDGQRWSIEGLADGNGDTSATGLLFPVYSVAIRSDTVFAGYLSPFWQNNPGLRFASMLADGTWQACGSPEDRFWFLESNGRMFNGGRADTLNYEYMPMVNEWAWIPVPGSPFGPTASVYDVAYWHGQYYFGGVFQVLGCRKIVAFDGVDQWTPLGGGVGGNFIETVCGYGDSLYVGGFFQPGQDVQSPFIQLWDGGTWKPFFPQVRFISTVRDMQVHEGALYVSGIHHWQGDTTWYGLLRYDGHQLCSIGGNMPSGDNNKMAFFQNNLYLGTGPLFTPLPNEHVAYLPLEGLVPDTCVVITPTGMAEHERLPSLAVYPNPASDLLTVRVPDELGVGGTIELLDGLGRIVLHMPHIRQAETHIPLAGVAEGAYNVVFRHGVRSLYGRVIVAR